MTEVRIVTAFLSIDDPPLNILPNPIREKQKLSIPKSQGNKILLLKRNNKVSHFQHHWSGISGSVERSDSSPLFRVYTEINEKIGLQQKDIQLVRTGKPIKIEIDSLGITWINYPYLFKIVSDFETLNLKNCDDEYEEASFFEVPMIKSLQCIPKLNETLNRVYLPTNVHTGLYELKVDRSQTALEYTWKALSLLKVAAEDINNEDFSNLNEFFIYLLNIAHHISLIRPTMSTSIINVVSKLLKDAKDLLDVIGNDMQNTDQLRNCLSSGIEKYLEESSVIHKRINTHAIRHLFPMLDPNYKEQPSQNESNQDKNCISILTTSYSSTIFRLLVALCHVVCNSPKTTYTLRITVAESRPLNEGTLLLAQRLNDYILAKNLKFFPNTQRPRITIGVITDSSVSYFLKTQHVTYCLLGAGRVVGEDGSVVNKMGSCILAMAANYHHGGAIPVFVVTQSDKIGEDEDDNTMEENDPSEVVAAYGRWWTESSAKGIEVRNVSFEKLDHRFISGYLMEDGLMGLKDMRNIWFKKKEARAIFDLL